MGFPYVTYIYGEHGGAFQRLAVLIMMARYRIGLIIIETRWWTSPRRITRDISGVLFLSTNYYDHTHPASSGWSFVIYLIPLFPFLDFYLVVVCF